jgi:hypothetical protein
MAEAGGSFDEDVKYYVEPNVELYSRLLWLVKYTKTSLQQAEVIEPVELEPGIDFDDDPTAYVLEYMIEALEKLMEISIKELEGKEITKEELLFVRGLGYTMDYIDVAYMFNHQTETRFMSLDTSALIADISTSLDGTHGEVAIGVPREIYAVCYVNETPFLARGSVYSFYEFVSETRMTDNEWVDKIGFITRTRKDTYGYLEYDENTVSVDQLEKMPWMKTYISNDPNMVKINHLGVEW